MGVISHHKHRLHLHQMGGDYTKTKVIGPQHSILLTKQLKYMSNKCIDMTKDGHIGVCRNNCKLETI